LELQIAAFSQFGALAAAEDLKKKNPSNLDKQK